MLVPLVLTPLNITVNRFAQLGIPVKSMATPLVEATAVPLVIPPLTDVPVMVVPVMVVAERVGIVVDPSAPSTMLFEPELGFLRLVVESVLIGSLVKDVNGARIEGICSVHGGDANAVKSGRKCF